MKKIKIGRVEATYELLKENFSAGKNFLIDYRNVYRIDYDADRDLFEADKIYYASKKEHYVPIVTYGRFLLSTAEHLNSLLNKTVAAEFNKQNTWCTDEVLIEDDHVNFECALADELYDTRFHKVQEGEWIHFYFNLFPDGKVNAVYTYVGNESERDYVFPLTKEEEVFFHELGESYCEEIGTTLEEMFCTITEQDEIIDETEIL